MHKINITSGGSPYNTKILLDEQPFMGIRSLDVRMRIDEVVTITTEMLPELAELEYQDPNIFIKIGDKKYRLMECVGDAECTPECEHDFADITYVKTADVLTAKKCKKCGKVDYQWDGDG